MSQRRKSASIRTQGRQAAAQRKASQESYQSMRQGETASNVRTQLWRQAAAARKARAAKRAEDNLSKFGKTETPVFEAFGDELDSVGVPINGNGAPQEDPQEEENGWSVDWFKILVVVGGGFLLFKQIKK